MPAALNHSAMSWLSAAAPEMKKRTRPPKRSRTLLKTSLSKSPCCSLQRQRHRLALALAAPRPCRPTLKAWLKIFSFSPPSDCLHRDDPAVRLLEDARRRAHEGRLHDAEVVDDLVDAAVDGGGEAAGELRRQQHLAERVRHRQPQELQVVLVEDVLRLDRGALVDPRPVPEPDALGPAGGAGGVDQRGELVGLDRRGDLVDDAGVLGEVGARRARRARSRPITQSPSVVPSKVTTL